MRAIQVTEFGGPEVLVAVDVPAPTPQPGELLLDVTGVGVNFADTHQTEDSYLSRQTLPYVPGAEVVGTVAEGPRAGERRCGFVTRGGGYAEQALIAVETSFVVPPEVSDAAALSLLVQGLTAYHLLRFSARMEPGESVVVTAAAGGVGSLAVQLARLWDAGRIIAVASSQDKIAQARELGATDGVVLTGDEPAGEVTAAIREANLGSRVDIVLEMTGGTIFDGTLAALDRFGRLVTFGLASRRAPQALQPASLMSGSKSVIGFWLMDCMTPQHAAERVVAPLSELVALVRDGDLAPLAGPTYALEDARRAHEDMRARRTTGKVVLDPRLAPAASA